MFVPPNTTPAGRFLRRVQLYFLAINALTASTYLYYTLRSSGDKSLTQREPKLTSYLPESAKETVTNLVSTIPRIPRHILIYLCVLGGAPGAHLILRLLWRHQTPIFPDDLGLMSTIKYQSKHVWDSTTETMAKHQLAIAAACSLYALTGMEGGWELVGKKGGELRQSWGWLLAVWIGAIGAWGEGKMESL